MDVIGELKKEIEERKRAEEALKVSVDIVRAMPSGLFIYQYYPPDRLVLLDGNPATKRLTGINLDAWRGKEFSEIWPKAHEMGVTEKFLNVMKTGETFETEELHYKDDNLEGAFSVRVFSMPGERMGVAFENITERKQAEKALQESEERFRILSEGTYEAIVIHEGGKILQANQQYYEMFDYTPEELAGERAISLTVIPEAMDIIKKQIATGNTGPYEVIARKKDGTKFPIEIRARLMERDGRLIRMAAIRDLSERKQVEEALRRGRDELEERVQKRTAALQHEISIRKQAQERLDKHQKKLRSLASQLSLAEEKERRRVATEVHDRIGQNLAFAKMKLDQLRMSASPDCSNPVVEIITLINDTIQGTRSLVSELGSPVLYELGLVPAIEWLTQKSENQHGLRVTFEHDDRHKPLSDDIQVFMFQATRELLANVAKHAEATLCAVSFKTQEDRVQLDVVDDGKGFNANMGEASGEGFGFFSIRERLEPLGGNLGVDSHPGLGTHVTLVLPLRQ